MSRESKKRVIQERIKLVHQLERKLDKIYDAQNALGSITLKKPLRDGWYKTFRLRADILRNKKSKTYQEVLDAVLVEVWGREKKHADKKWKNYFKRHYHHIQRPGIKRLNDREYNNLSSKAKKCFLKVKTSFNMRHKNVYTCLLPRYYFQPYYRRAYITERKIISSELESRKQEIMDMLASDSLRKYSDYYTYKYRHYHNPNKRERRKVKVELSKITVWSSLRAREEDE